MIIGIFEHLLFSLMHLAMIALDITFFFILARCYARTWPRTPLANFDRVGAPLVDALMQSASIRRLSTHNRLIVLVTVLAAFRLGATLLLHQILQ